MYLRPISTALAFVASSLLAVSITQAGPKRPSRPSELQRLQDMTAWARQVDDDLRRTVERSRRRLREARAAISKAAGLKPRPIPLPATMHPEPLWISSTPRAAPTKKQRPLPTVSADDFYMHGEVRFPRLWTRCPTRVRVTWLLFDGRHPPTLASALDRQRALYVRAWSPRIVANERMRFYERVSGLGLLPGRYIAVMHLAVVNGPRPRPEQLTFGALRVAKAGAAKVSALRPHHLGWYKSQPQLLKFVGLRLRPRRGQLIIRGRLRGHRGGVKGPLLLEVVAESGFRKHVLYRAHHRLQRRTPSISLTVPHKLPAGPYTIKIAVYVVVKGQGHTTFRRVLVTLP